MVPSSSSNQTQFSRVRSAFDPSGQLLCVAGRDGRVRVYDVLQRRLRVECHDARRAAKVTARAFAPAATPADASALLAVGYANGNTALWSLATASIVAVLNSHASVASVAAADASFAASSAVLALAWAPHRADRLVAAPGDPSGATAVTAVVFGTTLYVANIGDSECILVSREGQGSSSDGNDGNNTSTNTTTRRENITHTVMTEKHVLTDEAERRRVEACGGTVVFGRLDGTLEVSRAFGDAEYKRPGRALVSVEPHVAVRALARRDELLVLACDGFWDTVPHADAARHAAALRAAGTPPDAAAHALVQLALDRGSTDNVTVVLVYFDWTLNNPS